MLMYIIHCILYFICYTTQQLPRLESVHIGQLCIACASPECVCATHLSPFSQPEPVLQCKNVTMKECNNVTMQHKILQSCQVLEFGFPKYLSNNFHKWEKVHVLHIFINHYILQYIQIEVDAPYFLMFLSHLKISSTIKYSKYSLPSKIPSGECLYNIFVFFPLQSVG